MKKTWVWEKTSVVSMLYLLIRDFYIQIILTVPASETDRKQHKGNLNRGQLGFTADVTHVLRLHTFYTQSQSAPLSDVFSLLFLHLNVKTCFLSAAMCGFCITARLSSLGENSFYRGLVSCRWKPSLVRVRVRDNIH